MSAPAAGSGPAGTLIHPGLRLERGVGPPSHLVRFYERDDVLEEAVAKFVHGGLSEGEVAVLVATTPHWQNIARHLATRDLDVEHLRTSDRLVFLDAHETLEKLMRDGLPNADRFQAVIGALIEELARKAGGVRLRAYGEMVDILWRRDERQAALRLEELWNDLQARLPFTLFCAYAMGNFYKEPATLHSVCAAHTHVVAVESVAEPDDGPVVAATEGPWHTHALAREIAHRQEVEGVLRDSLRELRQREEELRRTEEQLRDFMENATVGLHSVDSDGTILWANRAELSLLGYAPDEYVGRAMKAFHVDQDAIIDVLARLGGGGEIHDWPARLRAKDGSIKHVLISSNAFFRDGKFVRTRCFTRDITERREAEEALRYSQRQLQTLTDALPVLVSFVDTERRYRFVSAAYERWFGHSKAEIVGQSLEEALGRSAYDVIRPHVDRALSGHPVTYEAEIPYKDGGLRFVEATYIPQFADDGQVMGFAALIADISERKGFERFRAAAVARTERLIRIAAAIAEAVNATEVFEAVVDHVAAAVDASSAGLWLLNEDGRSVKLARSIGYKASASQQFEALSLETEPSIPALDAIRTAEPLWISSQEELLQRYPHLRPAVTPGRSYRVSCLPLISQGRTLGALGLTIEEARPTTEDERSFLLLVARYASQALERLRLLESERRSRAEADVAAARMGVLSRASRTFVDADLDLAPRLEDIVRELGTALNSCTGIALLQADERLHTAAVHHPLPEAELLLKSLVTQEPLQVGEGVTGSVAQTGQSVLIPATDAREVAARAAPAYRGFLERYPSYAMICAPLRARGKVIGTVTATRTRDGETYAREDLALLEELADRAASAIENSRLHGENVAARARAEQLYNFAKSVVSADTVDQVFESALDAIAGALGTERGAILVYDDANVMRFRAWRQLSDDYRRAVEGHSPWPPDAVAPQPVLVPDVETDGTMKPYLPLFHREGIGSLAFIPLVTRGRLIGKFMVYHAGPHTYSAGEIDLAIAIASHLASVTARFAAMAKLEETVRYNELVAGVLAHDLRNPLGAIMTAAQLLLMRREGEGNSNSKPLSRIVSSGQRMHRMIDQLLDVTRARAGGGIHVELRPANLTELCAQAIGELDIAYPSWKIRTEAVGDQNGFWDADRLLQVISNLVGNAGQHGTSGSPIRVRLDGRQSHCAMLEVHNDGVIPESMLGSLFDPFRGTLHRRDYSSGLGLGLFIVREIVRAHEGTVDVTSSTTEGTTFVVRLPRHSPAPQQDSGGRRDRETPALSANTDKQN